MQQIFRYQFDVTDGPVTVELPTGAVPLSVRPSRYFPDRMIEMWALIDAGVTTSAPRKFIVFGTGHLIPDDFTRATFLGTISMVDGQFIGHVFEDLR